MINICTINFTSISGIIDKVEYNGWKKKHSDKVTKCFYYAKTLLQIGKVIATLQLQITKIISLQHNLL